MLVGPIDMAYAEALPVVTFDLCHAPTTLTLAHPNPGTSVNEFEDPGAIEAVSGWPVCM